MELKPIKSPDGAVLALEALQREIGIFNTFISLYQVHPRSRVDAEKFLCESTDEILSWEDQLSALYFYILEIIDEKKRRRSH